MTLSIKTNELKTRYKVNIDGHDYIVRKMGNLEQIEYARAMKRLETLSKKDESTLTEEEDQEVYELTGRISEIFIAMFDDGGDQSKSKNMLSSLSGEEIGELLNQIFNGKQE